MRLQQLLIIFVATLCVGLLIHKYVSVQSVDKALTPVDHDTIDNVATPLVPEYIDLSPAKFVGRQVCIDCHAQEHDLWSGSHHDLSMREATEASVSELSPKLHRTDWTSTP